MTKKLSTPAKALLHQAMQQRVQPVHTRLLAPVSTTPWQIEGVTSGSLEAMAQAVLLGNSHIETVVGRYKERVLTVDVAVSVAVSKRLPHGQGALLSIPNPPAELVAEWAGHGLKPQMVTYIEGAHLTKTRLSEIDQALASKWEAATLELEKAALAVRVIDPLGEAGITLTPAGLVAAEGVMRERASEAQKGKKTVEAYAIWCRYCQGHLLRTTELFKVDQPVTGRMLDRFGLAELGNWSQFFDPDDTGENIVCPGCEGRFLDSSGKIPEKLLTPIEVACDAEA